MYGSISFGLILCYGSSLHFVWARFVACWRWLLRSSLSLAVSNLEISHYAEIGIDDFFRMPSIRTIELALSGSSENEAYSVKSRAKDLAKKIFLSLSLRACACACVSLPPTRGGGCSGVTSSLSNYDQDLWPPSTHNKPAAAAHEHRRRHDY